MCGYTNQSEQGSVSSQLNGILAVYSQKDAFILSGAKSATSAESKVAPKGGKILLMGHLEQFCVGPFPATRLDYWIQKFQLQEKQHLKSKADLGTHCILEDTASAWAGAAT